MCEIQFNLSKNAVISIAKLIFEAPPIVAIIIFSSIFHLLTIFDVTFDKYIAVCLSGTNSKANNRLRMLVAK